MRGRRARKGRRSSLWHRARRGRGWFRRAPSSPPISTRSSWRGSSTSMCTAPRTRAGRYAGSSSPEREAAGLRQRSGTRSRRPCCGSRRERTERAYSAGMTSPPSLEGLHDSPYAAELRKPRPAARFAPAMEADYLRAFLQENRTLVRLSCTLAVLFIALRGSEVALGSGVARSIPVFLGILASSLALAWLAWSRGYERHYLPWAQVLLPL